MITLTEEDNGRDGSDIVSTSVPAALTKQARSHSGIKFP
jgi:hypothetical protein